MKRTVKADPSQWSAKSRQTLALVYTKEYEDIEYSCWHCRKAAVFTAEDQKHSFEVKKKHIDQRRILCESCWRESNTIRSGLTTCEQQWSQSKAALRNDTAFLNSWLDLLVRLEEYVPYHPDKAKKAMLRKLLGAHAQQAVQGPTSPPSAGPRP